MVAAQVHQRHRAAPDADVKAEGDWLLIAKLAPSGLIRGPDKGGNQMQSDTIRRYQMQSDAIRGHQRPSDAIRRHPG